MWIIMWTENTVKKGLFSGLPVTSRAFGIDVSYNGKNEL